MRDPLLVPGALIVAGVVLWPWWTPQPNGCLLGACACALLGLAGGVGLPGGRAGRAAVWAAALLLGSAAPGLVPEGPTLSGRVSVRGQVVSSGGVLADLDLSHVGRAPARGRIRLWFPDRAPPLGAEIVALGRAQPTAQGALPGAPDPIRGAAAIRAPTSIRVEDAIVLGPERRGDAALFDGREHQGLLRALARGDRSQVPDAQLALMERTGTRHLLAISGLHVGLVAALCAGIGGLLTRPLVWIWSGGGLRWVGALCGALGAATFAGLAGWPISAQRACWMAAGALAGGASGRGSRPWNLLGGAAAAVALSDPTAVRGLGFGLSFGAVSGILLVAPRIERYLPPDTPRPARWLVSSLAASLGATAGTLPLSAWVFQELPPLSPLANLVAVPLVGWVAAPAALLGGAGIGPAAALADAALGLLLQWLVWIDGPIWAPAVGPLGALGLGLAALLARRPALAAGLALLALGLRPLPPPGTMTATFLSVGQGDAALVELPEGRRILIDGGPSAEDVLAWLRRRGVDRLDEIALSHPHPDHMEGLAAVVGALEVGALRVPRGPVEGEARYRTLWDLARARGVPVIGPAAPSTIPELEVLHPSRSFLEQVDLDANEGSLVLRITHGRTSALFTGDIEGVAEASLAPDLGPIGWLKVPHHGSLTSSSPALLAALQPRVAVVSCGAGNRFRHPRPGVLWRYRGAQLLRTDLDGTIQLQSDGARERLRTWAPGRGWSRWRGLDEVRGEPRGAGAP